MTDLELARECGATVAEYWVETDRVEQHIDFNSVSLAAFASRIRAEERERCAKICETLYDPYSKQGRFNDHFTAAIRAGAGK